MTWKSCNCTLCYTDTPGDSHGAANKANCSVLSAMCHFSFLNVAKKPWCDDALQPGIMTSVNIPSEKRTEAVQLFSKAYLRVQEQQQMEMETVVVWLGLKKKFKKKDQKERGRHQRFKAAGRDLNRAVLERHTRQNISHWTTHIFRCAVKYEKGGFSSWKKKNCHGYHYTQIDSGHSTTSEMAFYHQSPQNIYLFPSSHPSLQAARMKTMMKWKWKWPGCRGKQSRKKKHFS